MLVPQRRMVAPECSSGSEAAGRSSLKELNLEWLGRSLLTDYYTEAVFWVKLIPHPKVPHLIYTFPEGKHHSRTALVLTVHCLPGSIMQDTSAVLRPCVTKVVQRL